MGPESDFKSSELSEPSESSKLLELSESGFTLVSIILKHDDGKKYVNPNKVCNYGSSYYTWQCTELGVSFFGNILDNLSLSPLTSDQRYTTVLLVCTIQQN